MIFISLLLIWSLIGFEITCRSLGQKQVVFDDHFTMTICMVATMATSFITAFYITLLFPAFQMAAILFALWVGWKIGSRLRNPAKLNGFYNGAMGGVMGTMLGAVIRNPALCNIPLKSEAMIAMNMYGIAVFSACLYTLVLVLIRYSFHV